MDYKEAIRVRHSVREYTGQPLKDDDILHLNQFIDSINTESGLCFQLIVDDKDTFGKSKLASYGKFANANNYIAVVGPADRKEEAGYFGEKIVLEAQCRGLNTCWVGLTYKRKLIRANVPDGCRIYALIAIGYGANDGRQHKSCEPQKIMKGYADAPEWARRGVEYALLAPTALNQQKFRFKLIADNVVKAYTALGPYTSIDLSIAKLHFEIGAAPHTFSWAK